MTRSLVRNVAIILLTYAVSFAAVQGGQGLSNDWKVADAGALLAEVAGVVAAIAFRARVAAYVIGAVAAFSASELTLHAIYGIRCVQSAPTHFAVLLAATVGIALGAAFRSLRTA